MRQTLSIVFSSFVLITKSLGMIFFPLRRNKSGKALGS